MRIPRRLRPRRQPHQTEKLHSIHFITCIRCMGHGYFATVPLDPRPMVAFSRVGALEYLAVLSAIDQISANQYAAVEREILCSGLPNDTPYVVREIMTRCHAWEEKRVELASVGRSLPEEFQLAGPEVAQAVHEFLLGPEGYAGLKTQ